MTEDTRPAYVAFHEVARFRAQLFDRLIAPHGLTMSQAWVLAHLFVDDGLTQTEIARRMAVGTVTVGGLVDRLEASGLVERRTAPNDRRANCVYRTKAATKLGRVMNRCAEQVNETAFAGMSEDVVAGFMTNLDQVRSNLAGAVQSDLPGKAKNNNRA